MRGLVLAALLVTQTQSCLAQMAPPRIDTIVPLRKYSTVYYGVLMPPARAFLEARWTDSTNQVERGYCVGAVSYNVQWAHDAKGNKLGKEVIARVWTVYEADTLEAPGASSITKLACNDNRPTVHTHPPTTCDDDTDLKTCVLGGMNAYQCQPSRTDFETLVRRGHRFNIIQCDKHAFRFYWPSEYRPDEVT